MDEIVTPMSNNAPGGIFKIRMDDKLSILYGNEIFYQMHGYSKAQMKSELKNRAADYINPKDLPHIRKLLTEAIARGDADCTFETRIRKRDGTIRWMLTSGRFLDTPQGKVIYGFIVDCTESKKCTKLAIAKKLERDPLTKIYNRFASETRIQTLLNTVEGKETGVFMMMDIDRFKEINDTYGHPFGDKILTKTAEILQNSFRDTDVVGRCGGDEFCAFFCGVKAKKRVEEIARTICEKERELSRLREGKLNVSCSIGISMCNGTAKTFSQLYQEADQALYTVKRGGRNGYAFFGEELRRNDQQWVQNAAWILDSVDAAIYICDTETYELLYMNDAALASFHTERSRCFGKKCYEILGNGTAPCPFCSMDRMVYDRPLERLYRFPDGKHVYLMKGRLVTWNGRTAHLETAIDVTSLQHDI